MGVLINSSHFPILGWFIMDWFKIASVMEAILLTNYLVEDVYN